MRVAIVSPRYGPEIAGGAERLAREYASRLARQMSVTVLTTCAHDYSTWRDVYPAGRSRDGDVEVHRFSVPEPRDPQHFDLLSRAVFDGGDGAEEAWMDAQGPNAPGLLEHLDHDGQMYDAVLFVPYLYATSVRALPLVADRAILIPAFHDEPWLRLRIYERLVASARTLVLSTPEELDLAQQRFGIPGERCVIVGAGIDTPPPESTMDASDLGTRPYVVCVGRIDPSKGSDALIRAHRALVGAIDDAPDLMMVGPSAMELPAEPWLHTPGFVSESEKQRMIANATALICPSPYESLSLVLLEAWAQGVPTICTAASPVLVGQSRRAGGGVWYRDDAEYREAVSLLLRNPVLAAALGHSGRRFTTTLSWSRVITRLIGAIHRVAGEVTTEPATR
jgi:glycosyltransferase involved in cell wall biosynthesis